MFDIGLVVKSGFILVAEREVMSLVYRFRIFSNKSGIDFFVVHNSEHG